MNFTNKAPTWNAEGVEPSTELQTNGFVAGYKPPAAYFNYLFNRYTACIKEAQEIITELDKAKTKTETDILALQNAIGDYTGGGEKNILQYETIVNDADHGSNCAVSKDGCITITNTTSESINPETEKQMLEAGTYTLSVTSDVAGVRCYFMRGDTVAGQFYTTVGTQIFNYTYDRALNHKVQFVVPAGTTANLYAQLETGDTATDFAAHSSSVADVLENIKRIVGQDTINKVDISNYGMSNVYTVPCDGVVHITTLAETGKIKSVACVIRTYANNVIRGSITLMVSSESTNDGCTKGTNVFSVYKGQKVYVQEMGENALESAYFYPYVYVE